MNCPKCLGPMRTVDRSGIHIEQCSQCRGVFLDAGELEQMVAAEEQYYGDVPAYEPPGGRASAPPSAPPPRYADSPKPYRGGYQDSPKPYRGGYKDSPPAYGHKRKRSFLENLFD